MPMDDVPIVPKSKNDNCRSNAFRTTAFLPCILLVPVATLVSDAAQPVWYPLQDFLSQPWCPVFGIQDTLCQPSLKFPGRLYDGMILIWQFIEVKMNFVPYYTCTIMGNALSPPFPIYGMFLHKCIGGVRTNFIDVCFPPVQTQRIAIHLCLLHRSFLPRRNVGHNGCPALCQRWGKFTN